MKGTEEKGVERRERERMRREGGKESVGERELKKENVWGGGGGGTRVRSIKRMKKQIKQGDMYQDRNDEGQLWHQ